MALNSPDGFPTLAFESVQHFSGTGESPMDAALLEVVQSFRQGPVDHGFRREPNLALIGLGFGKVADPDPDLLATRCGITTWYFFLIMTTDIGESETKFFLKVVDAQVEFFKNDKGEVTHIILHQGGQDMKGTKKIAFGLHCPRFAAGHSHLPCVSTCGCSPQREPASCRGIPETDEVNECHGDVTNHFTVAVTSANL